MGRSAGTFSHTTLGLSTPNKIPLLVPTQHRQEVMHTGTEQAGDRKRRGCHELGPCSTSQSPGTAPLCCRQNLLSTLARASSVLKIHRASRPFPPLADRVKGMEREPKSNSARRRRLEELSQRRLPVTHPLRPLLPDWPGRACELCTA